MGGDDLGVQVWTCYIRHPIRHPGRGVQYTGEGIGTEFRRVVQSGI